MLPAIFAKLTPGTRAPWVAILFLGACWALCLSLGFERLVTLDILVYGASLLLEFIALVVLRITEPALPRPFRVPGGLWVTIVVGVLPASLLVFSVVHGDHEQIFGMNALAFGFIVLAAGFVVYALDLLLRRARSAP